MPSLCAFAAQAAHVLLQEDWGHMIQRHEKYWEVTPSDSYLFLAAFAIHLGATVLQVQFVSVT